MVGDILWEAPLGTGTPGHPPVHLGRSPRRQCAAAWSQSPAGSSRPGPCSPPPSTSRCPAPSSSARAAKNCHTQGTAQEVQGQAPGVPVLLGYLLRAAALLADVEGDAMSLLLGAQQVDVVRDQEGPGARHCGPPPGNKGWGAKIRSPLWFCKLGRREESVWAGTCYLPKKGISLPSRNLP